MLFFYTLSHFPATVNRFRPPSVSYALFRPGLPAPPHKNAVIFVPQSGTKILASLHARLAEQGLARHLIRFEAGFAPSSSPCEEERLYAQPGF